MLNNISILGKILNINELKAITGGRKPCNSYTDCGPGNCCGHEPAVCIPITNQGLCGFYQITEPIVE